MIFCFNDCWFVCFVSLSLSLSTSRCSSRLPFVAMLCSLNAVDVWDGTDMPVVCHGNTLTTKIAFCDVITIIAEYAFDATKYVVHPHTHTPPNTAIHSRLTLDSRYLMPTRSIYQKAIVYVLSAVSAMEWLAIICRLYAWSEWRRSSSSGTWMGFNEHRTDLFCLNFLALNL